MCQETRNVASQQLDLMAADALLQVTDLTSPERAGSAVGLVSRLKPADRVNSLINVAIFNVPGPLEYLYFARAKLDTCIPVFTIIDGVMPDITGQSYKDRLNANEDDCSQETSNEKVVSVYESNAYELANCSKGFVPDNLAA